LSFVEKLLVFDENVLLAITVTQEEIPLTPKYL